jgi:hypothetical protein
MKNNDLSILKVTVFTVVFASIFFVITQGLFIIFPMNKGSIGWGLAVRFSYLFYGVVTFLSLLTWNFKSRKATLIVVSILILLYSYWSPTNSYSYPWRSSAVIGVGVVIYVSMHILYYKVSDRYNL